MIPQGATTSSVDASGRLTLREHTLDQLEGEVVITQGLDHQLFMMSPEQWELFSRPIIAKDPMKPKMNELRRVVIGPAIQLETDDRGRLKIPEDLRKWCRLRPGSSRAKIMYIGNRWEIWEEQLYENRTTDELLELLKQEMADCFSDDEPPEDEEEEAEDEER